MWSAENHSPHCNLAEGTGPTTGDVTLRQLRYFAVLGEELNYRRAAERLFITQPALSTAIKQLEHQLGVMLFTRTTREVALTELGQAWMPKVRDALHGIDAAVDDLIDLSAHYRRIRLGYLIGTGADLLFRLVRNFEAAYPEITLEPREFDFSDPTAGLADGTTEVAIIRPPVDLPEHRMFILDAENWVACLPRDHPLAGRSELAIAELLDDPIVVAPATAGRWRDYWMAMDARGGKPPTIAAVAATYEEETTTVQPAGHRLRADRRPPAQLHGARLASRRPQPRGRAVGATRPRRVELWRGPGDRAPGDVLLIKSAYK